MTLAPTHGHMTDGALTEKLASSTVDASNAVSLPPEMYRSQAIFDWERAEIFMKEWLCVGRSTDFAGIGDYKSLELVGEPIIVVRSGDGLRAFSAVCRHRGMIITVDVNAGNDAWTKPQPESRGNCPRAFRCPYHYWQYDHKGQLISAPEMDRSDGFKEADVKLPALSVEEWQGFVFVNFDPKAKPLTPRLAPVMGLIKNWGVDAMVGPDAFRMPEVPWNWKIMHENSIEAYHVDRLHFPKHFVLPSSGYLPSPYSDDDVVITTALKATKPNFALNPLGNTLFPPLDALTDEERQISYWIFVPPTLLIGLNSDSVFYRIVYPRTVDSTDIRQSYLVPKKYLGLPLYHDLVGMASDFHIHLNWQDHMVNSSIQRGMQSRYAPRGRYSWQEGTLVDFNRWLAKRYAGFDGK